MGRAKVTASERSISAGSDFLHLTVTDAAPGGRADWLTDRLRQAIAEGRVPVGDRLPPTRVLAADLGVSRGVVTEAYQRLTEEGHVAGRGRAGTVVVAAPATPTSAPAAAPAPVTTFPPAPGTDIFDAVRAAHATIDLTPGVPDLAAFPRADWLRAERTVLRHLAAADLGYGDPVGTPALRQAVAAWLARNRGISVDPAEVHHRGRRLPGARAARPGAHALPASTGSRSRTRARSGYGST